MHESDSDLSENEWYGKYTFNSAFMIFILLILYIAIQSIHLPTRAFSNTLMYTQYTGHDIEHLAHNTISKDNNSYKTLRMDGVNRQC